MSSSASAAPSYAVADTPRRSAVTTAQIVTVVFLGLAIALYFWVDSRYPSLMKKYHAGHAVKAAGTISFDAILPVDPKAPLTTRIVRTTGNWLYTNRIGMSFGIAFGAVLLTLLPMFSRRRFQSGFANTVLGVAAGAPLGVCANCVAPIGRGLVQGGASPNTALATMISSPTLNVVVLAMAFSLFPLPVAITKIATVLALLALVPWFSPKPEPAFACEIPPSAGAGSAVVLFLKNLGKMIAITLPFMILAGVLGAVLSEVLPSSSLPTHVSIIAIVLVALIGAFLPVPMAFDVAIAFVLMSRGVALPYVVTLLCTLGCFSIYSALIVGKSLSWKTAGKMYGTVAGLGIVAGLVTAGWSGL